jgi:hypothetical protein
MGSFSARGLGAATAVLAAMTLTSLASPPALADGDPASDVLLGQNVFYPYNPVVSKSIERSLNAETAAAAKAGFPIKVALIASPVDLGVIPNLFGKAQMYADFLDQEISFQGKQKLLVVMRTGYGVRGLPPAATKLAPSLPKPTGATSDALATAAISAVAKLAAASGHKVSAPGAGGSSSGGANTGRTVLLIVLVLAVLATAGALVAVRRRRGMAESQT